MTSRALALLVVPLLFACSSGEAPDDQTGPSQTGADTGDGQTGPEGSDDDSSTPGRSDGGATPKTDGPAVVRVHYPAGSRALGLAGATVPLNWATPTPLKSVGNDTWELSLGKIKAPVEVKPTLEGTPSRGPNYVVRPGSTVDLYPHFTSQRGKVSVPWPSFASTNLPDRKRAIRVYLPPSYAENTSARFPVVYMFDGQALFGDALGGGRRATDRRSLRRSRRVRHDRRGHRRGNRRGHTNGGRIDSGNQAPHPGDDAYAR